MSCNHLTKEDQFDALDYISGQHFDVTQCADCGLYLTTVGNQSILDDTYYPEDYYGNEQRYGGLIQWLSKQLIKFRIRGLEIDKNIPGDFLDIGCGQGWLVAHFSSLGWHSSGIEVSQQAAFHGKHVLGQNILVGADSSAQLESNKFDVICLWHVLEHVDDFEKLLTEIARLLKTDGRLLLGVPNMGSPEARWGKSAWFHLDVPRHLFHFDQKTLNNTLAEHKLEVFKQSYFVPEYDFFSFIQTAQNKLGIPMNLLYRTIRQGNLSEQPAKKDSVLATLTMLITLPVLGLASLVVIPLAVIFKCGSSITLVVGKN